MFLTAHLGTSRTLHEERGNILVKDEILNAVKNDKDEAVVLVAHSGTSTKSR
jgi:aspartate aminotransferase-like enzyme